MTFSPNTTTISRYQTLYPESSSAKSSVPKKYDVTSANASPDDVVQLESATESEVTCSPSCRGRYCSQTPRDVHDADRSFASYDYKPSRREGDEEKTFESRLATAGFTPGTGIGVGCVPETCPELSGNQIEEELKQREEEERRQLTEDLRRWQEARRKVVLRGFQT